LKTNEQEVQNLINNFKGNPSFGNLTEASSIPKHKQKIDSQIKKSVKSKNNKEDIIIMNSNHLRTKSNNYMATPNPFDDEVDSNNLERANKSNERANSKSKDNNPKLSNDKKVLSSNSNRLYNNNNNQLIYSKEFNRESNFIKNNKKSQREKNKL